MQPIETILVEMMASLTVKNIPEDIYEHLKQAALHMIANSYRLLNRLTPNSSRLIEN